MSFRRFISFWIIVSFFLTTLGPLPKAHADTILNLPAPGTMISLSPAYQPVIIKGLTVHKDNPFLFDFIVDVGQDRMSGEPLKKEGEKLIKYFLASLAIPDKDLWVNLSPYEKNRMIPEALGQTDMGRDLLEQDYILKQITASLIYPEKQLGKTFWDKVYAKAQQMYGTTQVPVNTFNKVWIMADKAEVFEHNQTAFVVDCHLKVMLEEDYLALQKHNPSVIPAKAGIHSLSSQIIRQIILPELEKEVNSGKNFANLRQIFNSVILSSWYKKNLKEALLNQVYANKSKVKGINLNDPTVKQQIYEQYLKAYKKGVFNYIKEDVNNAGATVTRKYFSGGTIAAVTPDVILDPAMGTKKLTESDTHNQLELFTTLASTQRTAALANTDAAMTDDSKGKESDYIVVSGKNKGMAFSPDEIITAVNEFRKKLREGTPDNDGLIKITMDSTEGANFVFFSGLYHGKAEPFTHEFTVSKAQVDDIKKELNIWEMEANRLINARILRAAVVADKDKNAAMTAVDLVKAKKDGTIKESRYSAEYKILADVFNYFEVIGTDLSNVWVNIIRPGSISINIKGDTIKIDDNIDGNIFAKKDPVAIFEKLMKPLGVPDGTVQPLGQPDDLSKPLPKYRWAWVIPLKALPGKPSQVLELKLLPMIAGLEEDEVLIRVYAVSTEANAGRWLPGRQPVDIPEKHGQLFHVPGNNPVGEIVGLGERAGIHRKMGDLVVTHNGSTKDPLAASSLRGDVSLQQTIWGYDSFQDDKSSPIRGGGHAQYVVAKWWQVMPKSSLLTFEQAATFPLPFPTIKNNFALNRLSQGETLLLIGASGSTGTTAIEYAKKLGVKRVIGLVSSVEKAKYIEALSTATTQIVAINRGDYDFSTDEGIKLFTQKVRDLNGGELADVALDFLGKDEKGNDYPKAFFASVKRGNPSDPKSLGGRFTAFGAELGYQVSVNGTEGSTTPEVMFDRVNFFRNRPDTEELIKADTRIWLGYHIAMRKIFRARENASQERRIKRVVIYGADEGALKALKAAQARDAQVVMIVGQKDEDKIQALNAQKGVEGVINISDYSKAGKLDRRTLTEDIRVLFDKEKKPRPDLVVERANQNEVLGIKVGDSMMGFSLSLLDTGGQVVYFENTAGHVFPYDIRAWVTQKDIFFPTASIILTHYAPIAMAYMVNDDVTSGYVQVPEPMIYDFSDTPLALEAMGGQILGRMVVLNGIPHGLKDLNSLRARAPMNAAMITVRGANGYEAESSTYPGGTKINIRQGSSKRKIAPIELKFKNVSSLEFSPKAKFLAVMTTNKELYLFRTEAKPRLFRQIGRYENVVRIEILNDESVTFKDWGGKSREVLVNAAMVAPGVVANASSDEAMNAEPATIDEFLQNKYSKLFGTHSVNGNQINVLQAIGTAEERLGRQRNFRLAARADILRWQQAGTVKPVWNDPVLGWADPKKKWTHPLWKITKTTSQIREGMIANALRNKSPHAWRLNDAVRPALMYFWRGLELTGPRSKRNMLVNSLNAAKDGEVVSDMGDFEDATPDEFNGDQFEQVLSLAEMYDGQWQKGRKFAGPKKKYEVVVDNNKRPVEIPRIPGLAMRDRRIFYKGRQVSETYSKFLIHFIYNFDRVIKYSKEKSGFGMYVPKIESPEEAELLAYLLMYAEDLGKLEHGTIKIKMLNERHGFARNQEIIEWILAPWLLGTNVGRWDYTNSLFELHLGGAQGHSFMDPSKFGFLNKRLHAYNRRNAILNLLVSIDEKREMTVGAPIGGMFAGMQSDDPEWNAKALSQIFFDKLRERLTGLIVLNGKLYDTYHQSWIASPETDYVRAGARPLQANFEDLEALVQELTPDQREGLRQLGLIDENGRITPYELTEERLNNLWSEHDYDEMFSIPEGDITVEEIEYALYMASEYGFQILNGNNAAKIRDYRTKGFIMNDFATYEIFWHWPLHLLATGAKLTKKGKTLRGTEYEEGTPVADLIWDLLSERRKTVKEYFQAHPENPMNFDREQANVIMDVLEKQFRNPEFIAFGARVLIALRGVEDAKTRSAIIDALFSPREATVTKIQNARAQKQSQALFKRALKDRDFVYDFSPEYEKAILQSLATAPIEQETKILQEVLGKSDVQKEIGVFQMLRNRGADQIIALDSVDQLVAKNPKLRFVNDTPYLREKLADLQYVASPATSPSAPNTAMVAINKEIKPLTPGLTEKDNQIAALEIWARLQQLDFISRQDETSYGETRKRINRHLKRLLGQLTKSGEFKKSEPVDLNNFKGQGVVVVTQNKPDSFQASFIRKVRQDDIDRLNEQKPIVIVITDAAMLADSEFKAYETKDSRGKPTVEVMLKIKGNSVTADVPAGASKGEDEAKTVSTGQAVKNILEVIAPALKASGFDLSKHADLVRADRMLIEMGAKDNFKTIGANATVPVSRALWKMAAKMKGMELGQYIRKFEPNAVFENDQPTYFYMNIFNGGLHALKEGEILGKNRIDLQEVMIAPVAKTYAEALRMGDRIDEALKRLLLRNFSPELITRADESGFSVKGLGSTDIAIEYVIAAIRLAGYKPGKEVKLALDTAASTFYGKKQAGMYDFQNQLITSQKMNTYYQELARKYQGILLSIEDGLDENDWNYWPQLNAKMKDDKVETIGDDIFVTQESRFRKGIALNAASSILIKVNQNGTMTGTLDIMKLAKANGKKAVVSHRSGETMDDSIADLAWGTKSFGLKTGDPQPDYDFGPGKPYADRQLVRRVKYLRMVELERLENQTAFANAAMTVINKEYLTLDDVNVSGKRVLIRPDLNASVKDGKISLTERIKSSAETINEMAKKGARVVVDAHQGRFDVKTGKGDADYLESLEQHAQKLSELIGRPVKYVHDLYGEQAVAAINALQDGEVLLLMNVRPQENDPEFVKTLEPLFDYMVSDGFSVAHRDTPSVTGFTHIPNIAGRFMQREWDGNNRFTTPASITHPYMALLGGSKISEHVDYLEYGLKNNLLDHVLTGGMLGLLLLDIQGYHLGEATMNVLRNQDVNAKEGRPEGLIILKPKLTEIYKKYKDKFETPIDLAYEDGNGIRHEILIEDLGKGENLGRKEVREALAQFVLADNGTQTANYYAGILRKAKTVFVKGPQGNYKKDALRIGSEIPFKAVAESGAFWMTGGGDTDNLVNQLHLIPSHRSQAGGALLELLAGKKLPGLERLKESKSAYSLLEERLKSLFPGKVMKDFERLRGTDSIIKMLEKVVGLKGLIIINDPKELGFRTIPMTKAIGLITSQKFATLYVLKSEINSPTQVFLDAAMTAKIGNKTTKSRRLPPFSIRSVKVEEVKRKNPSFRPGVKNGYVYRRNKEVGYDRASIAESNRNGGIDLNTSSGMQWKDSKDGSGVEMNVDPAMIARIEREGIDWLSPEILKMTPITSIWPLVGLQAPAQQEHLAKL